MGVVAVCLFAVGENPAADSPLSHNGSPPDQSVRWTSEGPQFNRTALSGHLDC